MQAAHWPSGSRALRRLIGARGLGREAGLGRRSLGVRFSLPRMLEATSQGR